MRRSTVRFRQAAQQKTSLFTSVNIDGEQARLLFGGQDRGAKQPPASSMTMVRPSSPTVARDADGTQPPRTCSNVVATAGGLLVSRVTRNATAATATAFQ